MILNFYFIFYEIPISKQNSPRWDAAFCGVTSGAMVFAYVPQKRKPGLNEFRTQALSLDSYDLSDRCKISCLFECSLSKILLLNKSNIM